MFVELVLVLVFSVLGWFVYGVRWSFGLLLCSSLSVYCCGTWVHGYRLLVEM